MHSFLWVTLLLLSRHAFCVLNNFTVDDSDPSIRYSPAGAWNARNAAQNCTGCSAKPDPDEMLQGTWHDGTVRACTCVARMIHLYWLLSLVHLLEVMIIPIHLSLRI